MTNFFSKVISIITSVVTTVFPFMGRPISTPLVRHTPIVEQMDLESPAPSASSFTSRPKETIPAILKSSQTPKSSQLQNSKEQIVNSTTQPTPMLIPNETWLSLENKYFLEANQKGWTTLIITNSLGEKRYYKKEGTSWVRKNSEAELKQTGLTPEQLAKIKDINQKLDQLQGQKDQQQELTRQQELKRLECIMAMTPEDERVFDPATQEYLRKLRCGILTDSDRTNYELSKLRYTLNELKYGLDSKMSFAPILLNPLQAPSANTLHWQVRWDGSGGTITDSAGKLHQFHCEDNFCRSY